MPFYGFKLNPKQAVEARLVKTFGRTAKVKVTGHRVTAEIAGNTGLAIGTYLVACMVGGEIKGTANHIDWRKAYSLLADQFADKKAEGEECVRRDRFLYAEDAVVAMKS